MKNESFSPALAPDDALVEVGQPFLAALVSSVDATRARYATFRAQNANLMPTLTSRTIANIIRDMIVDDLRLRCEALPGVMLSQKGDDCVVRAGNRVKMRVKRHVLGDSVSYYPTPTGVGFYRPTEALRGLEDIGLAVGYRWDKETGEIGPAVLTLQGKPKAKAVWSVDLDKREQAEMDAPVEIHWRPSGDTPITPKLDLTAVAASQEVEDIS